MLNVHLLPSLHIHHSCPTQLDNLYLYITKSWSVALIFVTLLLNHISSHVIYLIFIFSFLYLNFSSQYLKKKKQKKNLFFSQLVHTPTVTFLLTFPFPFCLFISPLLYRYTSFHIFYILTLLLLILFCIKLISFSYSIHIFCHTSINILLKIKA